MAELGRMLYFDRRLSGDGTMNCATCHLPGDDGFADGREFSAAYPTNGHFRNTPTTVNAALRPMLTWDGRAKSLAEQALGPIGSPFEMNINIDLLVEKLRSVPAYRDSFAKVFGGDVTGQRIAEALAEFEKTLISGPSPFDAWLAGDEKVLSADALLGMELFFGRANCRACHDGKNFGAEKFASKGLGANPKVRADARKAASLRYFAAKYGQRIEPGAEEDHGRGIITGKAEDNGLFLVPSLRQLARTGPYGHDGRFATLMEVIDLAASGGGGAPHASSQLKPIAIDDVEKKALEAFLLALTGDDPVISPPRLPEQ